jgi:hypothetical protein
MLNDSRSRNELEQVALKWEYSLMLRLLGPHQGIRLERIRSELDDVFEKYEDSMVYPGEDQTQLVEKVIPEISHTIESELPIAENPGQPVYSQPVQPVYSQPIEPVVETAPLVANTPSAPSASTAGTVGADGYEWLTDNGQNYYRLANSGAEWTLWQG